MKNEEIAAEIADYYFEKEYEPAANNLCMDALLDMAKRKEVQFRTFLRHECQVSDLFIKKYFDNLEKY